MKQMEFKIILLTNALLWSVLSFYNYLAIYKQISDDIMMVIVWCPFITTMYGMILYASTMVIARLYYIIKYYKIKTKFLNTPALIRQIFMLSLSIFIIYGLCYYEAIFMGLIPMLLFFSKKLMQTGKFYVFDQDRLLLFDDRSVEYIVKSVNSLENRIILQDIKGDSLKTVVLNKKLQKEEDFLNSFHINDDETKEVA